jgi:ABC-type multidrug transport system fused ATPase/permease subunit
LADVIDGGVVIGEVDLESFSRNSVRERLVCLSQDPLLLPGTFRFNLDPEGKINNPQQIKDVLDQVQMLKIVDDRGGLDADLQLDELSQGEQQLFALARAILKKHTLPAQCILVLDEATSNLDSATEEIVQKVINTKFQDSTIIAVAHRLDTLRGYDKVVVLDKGEVSMVGSATDVIAEINLE